MTHDALEPALALIFEGIRKLKAAFPNRAFTIDGRLVGDIGEVIASIEYDIKLDGVSRPTHDARTPDGRSVQIKATFKDSLTFKTVPELYLGFKLYEDGRHEEIFNGPGSVIQERFQRRKGIGADLLSFSIKDLRELSRNVSDENRVPLKNARLAMDAG